MPEARKRAAAGELAVGTIDSFLLWRLTGGRVHATDATNASRTLLFDIHRQAWDEGLLALFGVPRPLLPEVRDTAADYGATEAGVFERPLPILALVGDQQAAGVGQACFEPGMIKSTYGTGCFVLVNSGAEAPLSRNRLVTTVGARIAGRTTYALEGSIFIAGAAVQWLRDRLGFVAQSSETRGDRRRASGQCRGLSRAGLHRPRGALLGARGPRRYLRSHPRHRPAPRSCAPLWRPSATRPAI